MRGSRRSGGPPTPTGKERSRQNAVKHGIPVQVTVMEGEPRAQYDSLLRGLQNDFQPEGALENILVEKIASLLWRYRRMLISERAEIQGGAKYSMLGEFASQMTAESLIELYRQVPDGPKSDRLLRYEASLERAFDRALGQLERLQRIRLGQSVPPEQRLRMTLETD